MTLSDLIMEAVDWLADCGYDVRDGQHTDIFIILKVNRIYDGGWPEFVRADPDADERGTYTAVEERWPHAIDILYPSGDPTPTGDPLPIPR